MAVTVINAGSADGDIRSGHATYSTARSGSGTFTVPAVSANELHEGQLIFGTYLLHQAFIAFDLAAIPVGNVVSSAVLETYLVTDSSTTNFTCIAIYFNWGASVTSADWQDGTELAGQTWWTNRPTSGIGATGAYKAWADNGDIRALIQLFAGATVHLVLTSDRQVAGVAPPSSEFVIWASANTANPPRLTVTHHNTLLEHTTEGGLALGGSPEWDFTSSAATPVGVLSDVVVEWDFDNDGDFSEGVEDITPYFISAETVTGRDFPSGLTGETKPGQLKLTLLNEDDRFSYFNSGSPLAAAPMSLRTGRKIRVRTADAVADEPTLLARDRFNRADSVDLGVAETGQAWTNRAGGFDVAGRVASAKATFGSDLLTTLDSGEIDHYVQATLRQLTFNRRIGLVAKWVDANNHVYGYIDSNPAIGMVVRQRIGGSFFNVGIDPYLFQPWEGLSFGLATVGSTIQAYINGVLIGSGNINSVFATDTNVGLYALHTAQSGRHPEVADFHVWDHVHEETPGIIWTGDVADLQINPSLGNRKEATVTADGRLARAAAVTVASPRLPLAGAPTGLIVGDVLHRGGLLHPPIPLDLGSVTTGCVGVDDADALSLARMLEDTEQGILYETNEGPISFQDATARAGAASQAWFSDVLGVGQYPYSEIVPLDRRSQLINQVTAGVAPEPPVVVSVTLRNSNGHLDVVLPTIADDDLLVVFIASSQDGNQDWLAPIWWTPHRDLKGGRRARVYSHHCRPSDPRSYGSGATIRFREWNGSEAGIWLAVIVRVQNWFRAAAGVKISDFAAGNDPGAMVHGWGRDPTLFIVASVGIRGNSGAMTFTATDPPDGYIPATGSIVTGGSTFYDVGAVIASKVDCTEIEDPTQFVSLLNAVVLESVIFAVRGYNGPHTKQTLDNPNSVGGTGRVVTVDNLDSQADYNAVLSHNEPSHLFATEADAEAYGESIVAVYGEERQILELSFWAMSSAALRAQALARRVGDKITVTATGTTGLGIQATYFIESVNHQFSEGGTKWLCTWSISPA